MIATFGVLQVFFSILWFFLFVMWIMLVFRVVADVFRSSDMGGVAKALWVLFVIVAPFLGVLVYLIARGNKMAEHEVKQIKAQDDAMRQYIQQAAGTTGGSAADELARLAELRDKGVIDADEFAKLKAKVLG
jgi:hypothetical protein